MMYIHNMCTKSRGATHWGVGTVMTFVSPIDEVIRADRSGKPELFKGNLDGAVCNTLRYLLSAHK